MKYILLIFLLTTYIAPAQELVLVNSYALNADTFIGFDSYKAMYSIKDNVLQKQGLKGKITFSDVSLGPIKNIDIINPLKICVFYDQFNTVVFLDNRLNEIERINFNEVPPFLNISAATNAGNNKLWIFNADTQQVAQYDYRNNKLIDISLPVYGNSITLSSDFNYCYLLTENLFTAYNVKGGIVSEIENPKLDNISQFNETVIGIKENSITIKKENSNLFTAIATLEITVKNLQLTKDFLYIYDGEKLHSFTITQPKN